MFFAAISRQQRHKLRGRRMALSAWPQLTEAGTRRILVDPGIPSQPAMGHWR